MDKEMVTYEAKDYSCLLGRAGLSDALLNSHFKLYQGYVKNVNLVLKKTAALSAQGDDRLPEYAELKRRLGWEFNGMRLHEYYFENLGASGAGPEEKSVFLSNLTQSFGDLESWKKDFIATASMRGIGWVVCYFDRHAARLLNIWINEHDTGHLAGASPLLVLDAFEHAYMPDYQLDRAKYIESFFNNINWDVVRRRI